MTPLAPRATRFPAAVLPSPGAAVTLRPLATPAQLGAGFWGRRLRLNREVMIPFGYEQLERVGNFDNFRLAAGTLSGDYRALGVMFDGPFPFLDSDVHKWLEAVGWELGRAPDPELRRMADEAIELVARAQRADGYVNTFVQVLGGGHAYRDLAWGHDLYTLGHLLQAAVAWLRALGDERLLAIAERAVASVERELGTSGRDGIDGHPEIEMALVELYRATGRRSHLDLARRMVELRGYGLLGAGRFGAAYWQDHLPVRDAVTVAGHAVRQLYLDCGAVDVAVELGDDGLLAAVLGRWEDMAATRTYITGALGSHHKDEAFGDPFELPPDRAYAETCASIASVMLAWRLLLATGRSQFADTIERTMYNGVLPAVALDGCAFFYVNPLQRRTAHLATAPGDGQRAPWFPCACCPPNVMRTLASWPQYLATTDDHGIQIHQYATGDLEAQLAGGLVRIAVEADYPREGRISVLVVEAPESPWALSLRVPAWCRDARLRIDDEPERVVRDTAEETRCWRAGQRIVLDLAMPPRLTIPDARIDAVRGCVAIERGPIVYCLEDVDQPAGTQLEEIEIAASAAPRVTREPDLGDGLPGLVVDGIRRRAMTAAWPYHDVDAPAPDASTASDDTTTDEAIALVAVPYLAWANRGGEAMRIWVPRTSESSQATAGAGTQPSPR